MLNVVCVRQGDKFGPEYVTKLYASVARNLTAGVEGRFICFTDQPHELPGHIHIRPLPDGVTGWWSKLALFQPGLFEDGDRVLYFDLDTVIVGDLDEICAYDGEFAILQDFYRPQGWQSSVMGWRAGFGVHIWERWIEEGRLEIEGGDQAWIEECQRPWAHRWQHLFPGKFCSFKADCHPFPPEEASVVVFHGEPRPANCGVPWVAAMWSEGDTGHFHLAMVNNVTLAEIREQSKASAARDLKRITSKPTHEKTVTIVGGGPSLGDPLTMVELQRRVAEGCAIWALNGTYRWLLGRGIIPDALVILDARQSNAQFVQNVSPETTVYLASQCHPAVYDALLPKQIVRFDLDVMGDCGTTVGMYGLCLAFVEGFRKIHLYGYDSSYRGEDGHAYQQSMNSSDRLVDAHAGERVFKSAPWMVRQAQDFDPIVREIAAQGGEVIVHGDGLLPYIAHLMANPPLTGPSIRASEVMKRLNGANGPIGAEIGVFAGDMSAQLLAKESLSLLMVDSWEGDGRAYARPSGDWHEGLSQEQQDAFYAKAVAAVRFAGDRAKIARARSSDVVQDIADEHLDFVFIDADHSYAGCLGDIMNWWPKVKPGGLIGGHDYNNTDFPGFGVNRAVDQFAELIGQELDLGENFTWFLRKPDLNAEGPK